MKPIFHQYQAAICLFSKLLGPKSCQTGMEKVRESKEFAWRVKTRLLAPRKTCEGEEWHAKSQARTAERRALTADEWKDLTKETCQSYTPNRKKGQKHTLDIESLTTWTHTLQRERLELMHMLFKNK